MAKETFSHKEIEKAAQKKWVEIDLYCADLNDTTKDPYYLMFEFPFPSGDLHIGHWYAFALTDIYARYLRATGKNVLFPIGFDAFGLPAENAAMKRGLDTKTWTYESMERMRAQVRTMGTSVDWSKEVVTSDPAYYHWTQWLFTKLFEQGLAYRGTAVVNWDPVDNTVLANEQVLADGTAERSGAIVEKRMLEQWFLGITKYADRLLTDIEPLPWKQEIKDAQISWIGKSEGATLSFTLTFSTNSSLNEWRDEQGKQAALTVFTTRPDTVYGATYVVLAPEHPWVTRLLEDHAEVVPNADEVREYVAKTKRKSERERMEHKEKTGVLLEGVMALNPATQEEIPVYAADYVIGSYGTGAVMAVPAHDERDFEFAALFNLPIKQVVAQQFKQTTEPGVYRENEPTTVKDGIIAIIKHWSEEKYMGLAWKKVAWGTFLTGGVDEGMTPEETIAKEIGEETGYLNPVIVKKLAVVDGLFYHVPKEKNQLVHGHVFYVELQNGQKETVDAEEDEKHELKWLTLEQLGEFITPDTHKYALDIFKNGYTPYSGLGSLVDSGEFTGRNSEEAKWEIVASVGGERTTNYRLRDWLVSRQRYWGCPIPIVYDPEGAAHAVPAEHLPWLLPSDVNSASAKDGKAPLAASKELAERVVSIFGEGWTPECDTLDVFMDSSWYYLRYLDSKNDQAFSDQAMMKKWMPVNRYSGGSEHTTVHLLYARFFNKALYDLGLVPTAEPFYERFNRGLILGTDGQKMSKRWGNVVNPDEVVEKYGADAVRMYLAFIGPYNEAGSYPWKYEGVEAMRRFLDRLYTLRSKVASAEELAESSLAAQKALARAAQKIASDLTRFKTNTAVSALMILMNALEEESSISTKDFISLLVIFAPLAPHLSESLYEGLANTDSATSIHSLPWPEFDPALLEDETVVIGVQVAGKRRGEVSISPNATEEEAVSAALADPKVLQSLPKGIPSRVIYVPGRILNLIP